MDRINSVGTVVVAGIRQWINKNLLADIPGTQTNATFQNDFQEELVHAFIEASYVAGTPQVPTAGVQNQVKLATDFFYGWKCIALAGNHVVGVADRGTIFRCNTGCGIVTLPAANLFDTGFLVGFEGGINTTQCNVSGDLNNGGALQAESTFLIGEGDFFLLQAQGVAWGIVSSCTGLTTARGKAAFSTAGGFNFTVPNNVWDLDVTMTGAGAGGNPCSSTSISGNYSGAGGGAGATAKFKIAVVPGTVMSGTVGAPGASGGVAGGSTIFAGVTAGGGNPPSAYSGGSTTGGSGGIVTGTATGLLGSQINIQGGYGDDGMDSNTFAYCGNGGDSFWGGGGRSGVGGGAGGGAWGSGGGGARNSISGTGGAGAVGIVLIEWG